jgi:hypothetical protein
MATKKKAAPKTKTKPVPKIALKSPMLTADDYVTQPERAVLVTTEHRGVFFGYARDTDGATIKLDRARLCVYWSSDVKGFMGLANSGPTKGCRIGKPADITLRAITAVVECTPEATTAWETGPWAS